MAIRTFWTNVTWQAYQHFEFCRQQTWEADGPLSNNVPLRRHMRGVDHRGWLNPEAFLPDHMRPRLQCEATHHPGMVLGLYMRCCASISAPQLELHRWGLIDWRCHSHWVLYNNVARGCHWGQAWRRVIRPSETSWKCGFDFWGSERPWDHRFCFQGPQPYTWNPGIYNTT